MKKALLALAIVTLLFGDGVALATDKWWDINGTTANSGQGTGTGTWSTGVADWNTDSTGGAGGALSVWTSGTGDRAFFSAGGDATSAFSINLPAALTAGALTVEEGTVTKTGSALTIQTITVNNNAAFFTNAALALTVSAGGSLTLNGPNATVGNSNPGTGGSFLGSGTANTNMGIVLNGGGHVSANGGAAIATIYTGLISGTGPLVVDGNGIFRLTTTTATYSGATTVNGTLQISTTANVLPAGTDMTINSGGKFDEEAAQTIGSLTGAGGLTLTSTTLTVGGSSSPAAFTGVISNFNAGSHGNVTRSGSGTLTLGGANTYDGTFTNTLGTTTVNAGASLIGAAGNLIVNGGTVNLNNTAQSVGNLTGTGGTINLASGHTLTTAATASGTYSGTIAGAGGLTKTDANNLTLSGPNSYDGVTAITGTGTITVGSATALGSTVGKTTVASGALLNFQTGTTLTVNEPIDIAGNGNGVSSSAGAIFVQTANTNITFGGTVTLTGDAAVSVSGANLASADYSNATAFTFSGGTGKNLTLNGGSGTGTKTVSGAISLGTGSLTKLQSGTWTLSNAAGNSYSGGTAVSNGTLAVTNTSGSGTGSGNITVGTIATSTAGTLNVGNGGAGGSVSGDISFVNTSGTSNVNFNRTADLTYAGVISGSNGNVTKSNTNTLTFTGNHSYTGTTTISGGTLSLGNGGASGSITGPITDNAALVFSRSDGTLASPVTHAGAISGTGTVAKESPGVLALTNANTYGGGTAVNGGTLLANNTTGSATGSGNVSVAFGATLGGSGAVAGAVTVGGTLSPGNSIESLGAGSVTFSSGSTFNYEVNTIANTADLVNAIGGSLSIASAVSLLATDLNPNPNAISGPTYKYTMIAYDDGGNANYNPGAFAGLPELSLVTFTPGGKQFRIRYRDTTPGNNFNGTGIGDLNPASITSTSRFVTLTAVPELGSFITMGLVGCCAIGAVRFGRRYGFKALGL